MIHRLRGAGILVEEGRLLLVCDGAMPDGTPYWIPPGGGFEAADGSVIGTVRREFIEETGYEVDVGPLVFVREFSSAQENTHHVELFFRVTRVDRPRRAGEDRPWRWFSRGELRDVVVLPDEVKTGFLAEQPDAPARYLGVSHDF